MGITKLDILEVEANLYKYVAMLRPEDKIILCQGDTPVAEIRRLPGAANEKRPTGLGAGMAEIPDSFFDPLPDELLDLFEGKREWEDREP